MSSDRLTLVDYGADVGDPAEPTSDATEATEDTTGLELSNYLVDLASDVSTEALHQLADDCDTVREVAGELDVHADTARDDLDAIGRTESVVTRFEARWGISRATLTERASHHGLDADHDRERFCDECGNRVTEMSNGDEAGHQKRTDSGGRCSQFIGGVEE